MTNAKDAEMDERNNQKLTCDGLGTCPGCTLPLTQ